VEEDERRHARILMRAPRALTPPIALQFFGVRQRSAMLVRRTTTMVRGIAAGAFGATLLLPLAARAQDVVLPPESKEPKVEDVSVRGKPPPRSASDTTIDTDVVQNSPKEHGADIMRLVPGVFMGERGLLGRAPHLSLRGFDGTSGQDVEIYVGNIPLNQVTNLRAPGYADMRLIMPEIVKDLRVSHGPYDPHQGDFAMAGSAHMDLGLEKRGYMGKLTGGSFGTKRLFLAFSPGDRKWADSFAAFEAYSTDGPGFGRGGERSSFVGNLSFSEENVRFRGSVAIGSARFDFPGMLPQREVERGLYPYTAMTSPLGRDRTSQAHGGLEITWRIGAGTLSLGSYASKTKMAMHQNLTGFITDVQNGLPPTNSDDAEQVNEASTIGLTTAYRRMVELLSKRDSLELGVRARVDSIEQTDTRLFPNGTINQRPIDAEIDATNIAAYVDASLYPFKRVVVRGGTRVDSLSYTVKDRTGNLGIERTSQGVHIGNKATIDYAAGGFVHLLASYGEGFRSPQARDLAEGERVPFAKVRSVEAGMRMKQSKEWQASLVAFSSWVSSDRVFDAFERRNVSTPSSVRPGVATTLTARWGIYGASASGTFTHPIFTDSDARYQEGDRVPYAPAFVLRSDLFAAPEVGKLDGKPLRAHFGIAVEGAAGRVLPGGLVGRNAAFLDARASLSWREVELGINAMNLLGQGYYDAQYLYVSNFQRAATLPPASPHVLVAPPTSIFATLQIHLEGKKSSDDD
jgi:iron complex outermembrane receptor protein